MTMQNMTSYNLGRIKLGSMLAGIGRQAKLTDEEFTVIEQMRDKTPANPVSFE